MIETRRYFSNLESFDDCNVSSDSCIARPSLILLSMLDDLAWFSVGLLLHFVRFRVVLKTYLLLLTANLLDILAN